MANFKIRIQIPPILNMAQWILVIGIFFYNRIELVTTIFASSIVLYHYGTFKKSHILKYLIAVFGLSFVTAHFCGYSVDKMIQQMFFIAIIYLLYEQFFLYNLNWLESLFRKFIKVSYWVSCLGILELIVWIALKYDISNILDCQWITGMPGMTVEMGPLVRVRSTELEGGCLGIQLIPSLIYLFYFNDPYKVLVGRRRYVILFSSLFTVSPFVYLSLAVICYLKIIKLFPRLKVLFVAFGILGCVSLFLMLQTSTNVEQNATGVDGILMRIQDTSTQIEQLDDRDATLQTNVSTAVLMTNLYSAMHAPSRLFGTGVGTNRQNYERSYGFYRSYENSVTTMNLDDAYSLGIRIFSELGYVGIFCLLMFLIKNYKCNAINICMLSMIVPFIFRGGVYVGYGTTFIFFLYYYSSKLGKCLK